MYICVCLYNLLSFYDLLIIIFFFFFSIFMIWSDNLASYEEKKISGCLSYNCTPNLVTDPSVIEWVKDLCTIFFFCHVLTDYHRHLYFNA